MPGRITHSGREGRVLNAGDYAKVEVDVAVRGLTHVERAVHGADVVRVLKIRANHSKRHDHQQNCPNWRSLVLYRQQVRGRLNKAPYRGRAQRADAQRGPLRGDGEAHDERGKHRQPHGHDKADDCAQPNAHEGSAAVKHARGDDFALQQEGKEPEYAYHLPKIRLLWGLMQFSAGVSGAEGGVRCRSTA